MPVGIDEPLPFSKSNGRHRPPCAFRFFSFQDKAPCRFRQGGLANAFRWGPDYSFWNIRTAMIRACSREALA